MLYARSSQVRADHLVALALTIGLLLPAYLPPSETQHRGDSAHTGTQSSDDRTIAQRRVRPVAPAGPSYAVGASLHTSPDEMHTAFDRLGAFIGDWTLTGVYSIRPDLPDRPLRSRFVIDWDLAGMQLRLDAAHRIEGPASNLVPRELSEVMYLAWNRNAASYDAVAMNSRTSHRSWFAGAWNDDTATLTLYGALIGESLSEENAHLRIEFIWESEDRWQYRTAVRDPGTRQWLRRAEGTLERERLVHHADARE